MINLLAEHLKNLEKRLDIDNSFVCEEFCTEISLQSLWFDHLLPRKLRTTDGLLLYVEQTGFWNHGPGPDFIKARIRLENGQVFQGDIELHLDAKDWFKHHHHSDPAYKNVILHISLYNDEPILHHLTGAIKSVELCKQIDAKLLDFIVGARFKTLRGILPSAQAGKCSKILSEATPDFIKNVLYDAGLLRLYKKAFCLQRQRSTEGDYQTLWECLAECLGFSENSKPFRLLARLVPFEVIESCSERMRDSLLLGAAGFLPKYEISTLPEDFKNYFRDLWHLWWSHPLSCELHENFVKGWSYVSVRPNNHPHRRVGALSKFSGVLLKCLVSLEKSDWQTCLTLILNSSHEHFDYCYNINGTKKFYVGKLIGRSRANQILWNCFIPWMLSNTSEWNPEWNKCPSEPENIKIKRVVQRLFPSKKTSDLDLDGLSRQGLIEICQRFCSYSSSDCVNCAFPGILSQKITQKLIDKN